MNVILKISKLNLVKGIPELSFVNNKIYDACIHGKQTKVSFKIKNVVSTFRPLKLLHHDLFGPTHTASLRGKRYALVVVDDYLRFSWTLFLAHKNYTHLSYFQIKFKMKNMSIVSIRSDNGGEFENNEYASFDD